MAATDVIRVLVVDDHPVTRRGLRDTLADETGFEVAGQAANGVEAVTVAQETRPDVIVTDRFMPHKDGVEACREITELLPHTRVQMLTASAEEDDVIRRRGRRRHGLRSEVHGERGVGPRGAPGGGGQSDDPGRRGETGVPAVGRGRRSAADCGRAVSKGAGGAHPVRYGKSVCGDSQGHGHQQGDRAQRHLPGSEQTRARVPAGDRGVGRPQRSG